MSLPLSILKSNDDDPPKTKGSMSWLRRRPTHSARPSISWPIESQREAPPLPPPPPPPPPPPIPTILPKNSTSSNHQSRPSDSSSASGAGTVSTAPTSIENASFNDVRSKPHSLEEKHPLRLNPVFHSPTAESVDNLCSTSTHTQSCELDLDNYFDQFRDDVDISDEPPNPDRWQEAGDVQIYDQEGNARRFGSLFEGDYSIGEQQLVVFVRHFFCGACQGYLRTLSTALPLNTYFTLPVPSSITIIGLGSPKLIPQYRQYTSCPFPIYADPSRKLYKLLDMGWTLNAGKKVSYMGDVTEMQWLAGQFKQVANTQRDLRFKGGNWLWVGGEFLVKDNRVAWCRRMRNYRGHSDVKTVLRLLGAEE